MKLVKEIYEKRVNGNFEDCMIDIIRNLYEIYDSCVKITNINITQDALHNMHYTRYTMEHTSKTSWKFEYLSMHNVCVLLLLHVDLFFKFEFYGY